MIYLILLAAVIVFMVATAIIEARKTKRALALPVTEKVRLKWYNQAIIWGCGVVAAVLLLCLLTGISLQDIGFRPLSFTQNIWLTVITLVLCAVLTAGYLYQMTAFMVSPKYREGLKAKLEKDKNKSHRNSVLQKLLLPRSKKEKHAFFWVSLTAGVSEEVLMRGFFFFLLAAVWPSMPVILIVIIASVIFGIAHLYQGLQGIFITTVAGALLGCLYLVTGSLILPILLHFLADVTSSFLASEEE